MRLMILTTASLLATSWFAMADPIEDRQALMKANGRAVGSVSKIAKGEEPFDQAKVMTALQTLANDAAKMDVEALFPVGTETGGDTEAAASIWEDRAGFTAAVDKFKADTASAVAANPQDLAAFQAEFQKVTANCGGCHRVYRD